MKNLKDLNEKLFEGKHMEPCRINEMLELLQSHPEYQSHKEYIKDDVAYCEVKIKGCDLHVSTFSKKDAILAGLWGKSPLWKSYPEIMLTIRARQFALRNHAYMIRQCHEKLLYLNEELIEACKKGNIEEVESLIKKGADINAADRYRWTALLWSSANGHTETANLLIEKGANVNFDEKCGYNPLIMASKYGHREIVKILIDAGVDLNDVDCNNKTALMRASENCDIETAKLLIEAIEAGAKL